MLTPLTNEKAHFLSFKKGLPGDQAYGVSQNFGKFLFHPPVLLLQLPFPMLLVVQSGLHGYYHRTKTKKMTKMKMVYGSRQIWKVNHHTLKH